MDSFWGRVLFEVSFNVCLGEGSQIQGPVGQGVDRGVVSCVYA